MAVVLYAGSFDPIHLGHVSVIDRASSMFDSVVVAVVANPSKRAGLFTVDERVDLVRSATMHLLNVTCITHHGLTVDAVKASGAEGIIRTGHKDRADEWPMLAMNERVSGYRTFFVPPDPELQQLSSTLVRSLVANDRMAAAADLVPAVVASALNQRHGYVPGALPRVGRRVRGHA